MNCERLELAQAGFHGAYYPCKAGGKAAVVYMLGPSVDGFLVKIGVKWLHSLGLHVLAMAPEPKEQGYHDFPLERFGAAIKWLRSKGVERLAVAGGSATAMMALAAASYYPDFTLTLAMTPCDFIMEGYYRDKLAGAGERPSGGSIVTWQGKQLPYLPYADRHPDYWKNLKEEARKTHNMAASRSLFARSEALHDLIDAEMIPVERIRGTLILAGAEDDSLWNTCRYIGRMKERILTHGGSCRCETYVYSHGTHFLFPQSMLQQSLHILSGLPILLFQEGRHHPWACKKSRIDFDRRITEELNRWKQA